MSMVMILPYFNFGSLRQRNEYAVKVSGLF